LDINTYTMGPRYVDPFQRAPGGFDEDGASIFIYPEVKREHTKRLQALIGVDREQWEQLSTRKIKHSLALTANSGNN